MAQVTLHDADGHVVEVEEGQLRVLASGESEFEAISERKGLSFTWTVLTVDQGAGAQTGLLLQNTSDQFLLHIEDVIVSSDVATEIDIHLTDKAALTHSGTNVVGICLNQNAIRVAPATATADEANNAQGNIIDTQQIAADEPYHRHFGGALILGKNGIVAVDITEDVGGISCSISGYFKET